MNFTVITALRRIAVGGVVCRKNTHGPADNDAEGTTRKKRGLDAALNKNLSCLLIVPFRLEEQQRIVSQKAKPKTAITYINKKDFSERIKLIKTFKVERINQTL